MLYHSLVKGPFGLDRDLPLFHFIIGLSDITLQSYDGKT